MSTKNNQILDQSLGCMVGGAVGDALGYTVEFESWSQIESQYGTRGIREYRLDKRGLAQISDDTQMSLFTALGILVGMTRGSMRGIMGRIDTYCRYTYVDWLHTQEWPSRLDSDRTVSWLLDVPELFSRRAPGNTCLTALHCIEACKPVENDSCGCGGVMRTAPLALLDYIHQYADGDLNYCDMCAAEAARITHRHPLGFIPSAILNHVLMLILRGDVVTREDLMRVFLDAAHGIGQIKSEDDDFKSYGELWPHYVSKMESILSEALQYADTDMPDVEAIERIGGGWTGHEALAIAAYCSVKHFDSFEDAVISAVNHSGDSDSTGAICGNIMGCIHGRKAIPSKFTDKLELLDVIEEMAHDLWTGCIISEYDPRDTPEKQEWFMKYVFGRKQ